MRPGSKYWFPAKRYGWGWGLPTAWQGWAAVIAVIVGAPAGIFLFPLPRALPAYLLYTTLLIAAFAAVCVLKGEPPRWRWGRGMILILGEAR